MRTGTRILALIAAVTAAASCVHEFPVPKDTVEFKLRLEYETMMTPWEHEYDEETEAMTETGTGEAYDSRMENGRMRYIIRAYPVTGRRSTTEAPVMETTFMKDIGEGYEHELQMTLEPGEYDIMVWADMVENEEDAHFYNAEKFTGIALQGEHTANCDFRDAFKGKTRIRLVADVVAHEAPTFVIGMQRPLAKFEFITNDVREFIERETTRTELMGKASGSEPPTKAVDVKDYQIVFYYQGFMASEYNLVKDEIAWSETGVSFGSRAKKLNDEEATIGFDYVFVGGTEAAATVRIGIFDSSGERVSLTKSIKIPLRRSHHTVVKGMFLMQKAAGGVTINPDYEGDHNLVFP